MAAIVSTIHRYESRGRVFFLCFTRWFMLLHLTEFISKRKPSNCLLVAGDITVNFEQPNCNGNTLHSEAWNADAWLYLLQTSISITLLNRMFPVMCTALPYLPTLLCRCVASYTSSQKQNVVGRSQVWWIGNIIPLPTWFLCFSDLLE